MASVLGNPLEAPEQQEMNSNCDLSKLPEELTNKINELLLTKAISISEFDYLTFILKRETHNFRNSKKGSMRLICGICLYVSAITAGISHLHAIDMISTEVAFCTSGLNCYCCSQLCIKPDIEYLYEDYKKYKKLQERVFQRLDEIRALAQISRGNNHTIRCYLENH